MGEKLHEYRGTIGWFHNIRDAIHEKIGDWKEDHPKGLKETVMDLFRLEPQISKMETTLDDYPHIYRRKTRTELVRLSAAVMGIEFSYAAETAFVSPTLLKIGLQHRHMTLVWGLSPLIGFFLTPLLGSLSDRCGLRMGRRRPFIVLLALGVLAGLILVPNGRDLGQVFGDSYPSFILDGTYPARRMIPAESSWNITTNASNPEDTHVWGIAFTVLGTVLLDFDADSCQSPARSYLLDVTLPGDHARGLSTFTIMAGLGGCIGYALGGINWDMTSIGAIFGGHVRAVFSLVTVLFIICVACTVTAFEEIPLELLEREKEQHKIKQDESVDNREIMKISIAREPEYGSTAHFPDRCKTPNDEETISEPKSPSLKEYLLSLAFMPKSLRMICLTNLFSWMAHVCYSLYFTDFVGEAVFNGNPTAPVGSEAYRLYEDGVRFGCWGMSMYSLSCSCYSVIIEGLIRRFRARNVYVGGLLCYCCGMAMMALWKNKVGIIIFSWTAGVMYSTMFTMPYLLVAHYHSTGIFELTADGEAKKGSHARGLGTDVAITSSMVFLAQFTLSLGMGTVVSWAGTTTAVVCVASALSFCGAISATRIIYFDL